MRWLCLYFPWLELELHGVSADTPQAQLDKRQRIQSLNPAAEREGVAAGQALATALALSPGLVLLESPEERVRTELEQLALWAGGFSGRVSLCPPRSLLLEVASMLHYFGGLGRLTDRMIGSLVDSGYSARLAVGETALGTELLSSVEQYLDPSPEQWWRRLGSLKIEQLRLLPEQVEQLQGVGMRTLHDLRQLPRHELAQRFGQSLICHLDRIVAVGAAMPEAFIPPEHFLQHFELGAEITYSQGLLFPLRRLLAALEGYLSRRQQRVSLIRLYLKLRDGSVHEIAIGHAGGIASADQWLDLCRLRLERESLRSPVLRLSLSAGQGEAQEGGNGDLFVSSRRQGSSEELISRLRSRLGHKAVRTLTYRADHRPEAGLRREKIDRSPPPPAMVRPGWLLEQPQPLSTAQCRRLEILSGPERISSGWWDSTVTRDYFVARWPDGRCGWLYREPSGRWFIHGWFG